MSKPATAKSKGGKSAKGGKGKKGKKSKKELERERELEEQRKKEEEARLLDAKLRKERELRDKQEQEAVDKLFSEEADVIASEEKNFESVSEAKGAEMEVVCLEIHKHEEWKRYLECSRLPDPKSECDMNTYLNIWAEEPINEDQEHPSLDVLFAQLKDAEELCDQVERRLANASDRKDQREMNRLTEHLLRIRKIVEDKCDTAAALVVQYADVFNPQREANENFVYMAKTDRYSVGIWGNLTKNPRHKSIDFADLRMSTGLPKPLALANVAIVMLMQTGACAAAEYDQYVDSTSTAVVGGVLNLMLAEMPELPKTVDKWTIRQILSPTSHLKRIEYPFKRQTTDPAEEDTDDATWTAQWPTQITHALPKGVFLHPDSVTVKYWSPENKQWQDDGVEDVEIDLEHNQVRFRTIHFKPSAVVQDSFSELPYVHWHMWPSAASPNLITLTISGKSQQIQVEIGEQGCRLLAPVIDANELNDPNINRTWMSASLMFKRASRLGLNFVAPRSFQSINVEEMSIKNPQVEDDCIAGISFCSSVYEFQRSAYNKSVGGTRCLVEVREMAADDPGWKPILFDSAFKTLSSPIKTAFFMKEKEFLEGKKLLPEEGVKPHAGIYHAIKADASEKGQAGIAAVSGLLAHSVAQVLNVVKVLSFS